MWITLALQPDIIITEKGTNLFAVDHSVSRAARAQRNGHKGGVIWFTGLSGSGKSTLALESEQQLFQKGYQVYVLDGDNVRGGLNANLSFSPEDRAENIRRVGEVAALFAEASTTSKSPVDCCSRARYRPCLLLKW